MHAATDLPLPLPMLKPCMTHKARPPVILAAVQNAKNCLREGALAKFLDLVVW